MKNVAVILAGGTGQRSGFARPKQLVKLAGRPVLSHTLERFQTHPDISEIAIVAHVELINEIEEIVRRERLSKVAKVLCGGRDRYESSLSAIRAYEDDHDRASLRLIFHDAVRPLVSRTIISDVISALAHYGAVDTAIPAADTVLIADNTTNTIEAIPDRSSIRLGQTPQGFHYHTIKLAYERALLDANFKTTDDCGVVLRYAPEYPIYIVQGSTSNAKLTFASDLLVLDKFMQAGAGKKIEASGDVMSLSRLRGMTIVVFGGTSGIGSSIVSLAAAFGANAISAGRSNGVDVRDAQAIERVLAEANAQYGRVDAVVNSAAVLNRKPLSNMTGKEVLESIEVNVVGALNVARLSYPYLESSRGHLLMFASSSYTYGRAFYSTYSASKAAIVNLTQALSDEWLDTGIKVNCLNPERTKTPMRTKAFGIEDDASLLTPDEVGRRALGILVDGTTGVIYDVTKS